MARTKTKVTPSPTYVEAQTQSGGSFEFGIPAAAILYHTGRVRMSQEDKIDNTLDDLCDAFESNILN